MAFEFRSNLDDFRYLGFDVNRAAIGWARKAFAGDPRIRFELAEIDSPFGEKSARNAEDYRFPVEDGQADLVLAKSVFTHLLESEARHYLCEIRRALKPGRAAVVTALLFAPESRTGLGLSPAFPFGDAEGNIRWRWKARPESAIAYERDFFLRMITDAGLRLQWLCQGFFPGDAPSISGQDILLLVHASPEIAVESYSVGDRSPDVADGRP